MYTPSTPEALSILLPLYNSPNRYYHNLNHIYYCLNQFSKYLNSNLNKLPYHDNDKIIDAIWWHDAIYSPFSFEDSSNEIESSLLYKNFTESISPSTTTYMIDYIDEVQSCIEATANHLKYDEAIYAEIQTKGQDTPKAVMLDIDLIGFSRSVDDLDKDTDKIFKEYAVLNLPEYIMIDNRIKFLETMLTRERLYYTDYFYQFETIARYNISKHLNKLIKFNTIGRHS